MWSVDGYGGVRCEPRDCAFVLVVISGKLCVFAFGGVVFLFAEFKLV